jgi:hypothetical protein
MSGKRTIRSGLGLVAGLLLGGCVIDEGNPGYSGPGHSDPRYTGQGYTGSPFREPPRRKIFEPEKHVVCNSKRQVCYEDHGGALQPSVRETKQYFGKGAAKDLKKDLRRRNGD